MYLKLPWIGNISRKFEKQVKSNIQNCFRAVDPRVILQTRKILPLIYKDTVPITHQSMVVYQYVCHCDCRYVGLTSLRLQDRINQHIPKSIRNKENPTKVLPKRNCKITTPLNQRLVLAGIFGAMGKGLYCDSYKFFQFFILRTVCRG